MKEYDNLYWALNYKFYYVPKNIYNKYKKVYVENDNLEQYYVCSDIKTDNSHCINDSKPRQSYECYKIDSSNHYMFQQQTICSDYLKTNLRNTPPNFVKSDFVYRHDLADILVIVAILFTILVLVPLKVISKIFGKWLKI